MNLGYGSDERWGQRNENTVIPPPGLKTILRF